MMLTVALIGIALTTPQTVICIDPGHPSEVSAGTRGKFVSEVEVVWKVAQKLKPLLERDGYKVLLTKSAVNHKVTNAKRASIANVAKAALMLRLHCDHAKGSSGFSTIFPDRQGRQGNVVGPSLDALRKSQKFAPVFHREVMSFLNKDFADRGLMRDRQTNVGSRYGALIGSIHAKVPSLLVEICVLSDPKDEAFVRKDTGIQKIAQALRLGVNKVVPIQSASVPKANW